MLDWEPIQPFKRLERIRVPGGWIYRTEQDHAVAMCFVPEVTEIPIVKVKEVPPTS